MTTREPQQTSTGNTEYNLVSVIYHALESALSASVYMTDAQWIGDQELSQFFWQNQQEQRRTADRAEQLLNKRLSQSQSQGQSQNQQNQQQGQAGQGQMNQGMYGQGQFGQQGQFGGYGQGMYGGGYGYGPGMYGGGYGYGPGMYGGGYGYGPGMYSGGYGGGQFSGGYGGNQGGMYSGQFGGGQFGGSGTPTLRQVTGTSDVTYDLISTMYHALESAQTIQTYIQDVQGDQELTQFFQQIHQEANRCADHAKRLLAPRLSHKKMRQSQFSGSYYGGQGYQTGTGTSSQSGQTVGAGTATGTSATGSSSTGTGTTGQTGTGSSGTGKQG